MQEHSDAKRNPEANASEDRTGLDALFPPTSFPRNTTTRPTPVTAGPTAKKKGSFGKVVLPLVIFVVAIGVITWISQYQSGGLSTKSLGSASTTPAVIAFDNESGKHISLAVWRKDDPGYVLEFERGATGFYDFRFVNISDQPATFGIKKENGIGCGCSSVKVCILPADLAKKHVEKLLERAKWNEVPKEIEGTTTSWVEMKGDDNRGVEVPPGQAGILRLTWEGRGANGSIPNLKVAAWSQPKGNASARTFHYLSAPAFITSPVRFSTPLLDIGTVVPNVATSQYFYCWSPTRDEFELRFPEEQTNPCFQYKVERIDGKEVEQLRQLVKAQQNLETKVRCAYRVTLIVVDEAKGHQLDMGPIYEKLRMEAVTPGGVHLDVSEAPIISGMVRSVVRVGGSKDGASIDLGSFRSEDEKSATVVLTAEPDAELKILEFSPAYLQASLKQGEVVGNHRQWHLSLRISQGRLIGNLQDYNANVLIQTTQPNGQTRRMRIPVRGTGIIDSQ